MTLMTLKTSEYPSFTRGKCCSIRALMSSHTIRDTKSILSVPCWSSMAAHKRASSSKCVTRRFIPKCLIPAPKSARSSPTVANASGIVIPAVIMAAARRCGTCGGCPEFGRDCAEVRIRSKMTSGLMLLNGTFQGLDSGSSRTSGLVGGVRRLRRFLLLRCMVKNGLRFVLWASRLSVVSRVIWVLDSQGIV